MKLAKIVAASALMLVCAGAAFAYPASTAADVTLTLTPIMGTYVPGVASDITLDYLFVNAGADPVEIVGVSTDGPPAGVTIDDNFTSLIVPGVGVNSFPGGSTIHISAAAAGVLVINYTGADENGEFTNTIPFVITPDQQAVPEPGSIALLVGVGAVGLLALRRRK